MEIIVNSKRSLLFLSVALTGQVKRKDLCGSCGARGPTERIVKELTNGKIFTLKKALRTNLVRLKMPEAKMLLQSIPSLDDFYVRQTDDHRFDMAPASQGKRKIRAGTVKLMCLSEGFAIDGINVHSRVSKNRTEIPPLSVIHSQPELRELIDGRGHTKAETETMRQMILILKDIEVIDDRIPEGRSYSKRLSVIDKNKIHYFSSKDVKSYENESAKKGTLNINSSKIYGHIIGGYNSYSVFFVDGAKEVFSAATERRARNYIENKYMEVYGAHNAGLRSNVSPKGECIIVYENEDAVTGMIETATGKNNKKTYPMDIYSKSYAVPTFDKRLTMLTQDGWREKLRSQLFTISQLEEADRYDLPWCDAIIDGNPAIELYSMDLNKILSTKKLLEKSNTMRLNICCREKDEELILKFYKGNEKQITMKKNE